MVRARSKPRHAGAASKSAAIHAVRDGTAARLMLVSRTAATIKWSRQYLGIGSRGFLATFRPPARLGRAGHHRCRFELLDDAFQLPTHGIQHLRLLLDRRQALTANFDNPLQFARPLLKLPGPHRGQNTV